MNNYYFLTFTLCVLCVICLSHAMPEKRRASKQNKERPRNGKEFRNNVDESSSDDLEQKRASKLHVTQKGHVTRKLRIQLPENRRERRSNIDDNYSPKDLEDRRLAKIKLYALRKGKAMNKLLRREMAENNRGLNGEVDKTSPEDVEHRKVAKMLRMNQKGKEIWNDSYDSVTTFGGERAEVHGGRRNYGGKRDSSDSSLDSTCGDRKSLIFKAPPLKRSKSSSPRKVGKIVDDLNISRLRRVNSIGERMDCMKLKSVQIPIPVISTSFFANSVDVESSEGSCDGGDVTSTPATVPNEQDAQEKLMESFDKMRISGSSTRRPAYRSGQRPIRSSSAERPAIHDDPPTEGQPRSISPERHHRFIPAERIPTNLIRTAPVECKRETGPDERSGTGSAGRATHRRRSSSEHVEIPETRPADRSGAGLAERAQKTSPAGRVAHRRSSSTEFVEIPETIPADRSGAGLAERAQKTSPMERVTHRRSSSTARMETPETGPVGRSGTGLAEHAQKRSSPSKHLARSESDSSQERKLKENIINKSRVIGKRDENRRSRAEEEKKKEEEAVARKDSEAGRKEDSHRDRNKNRERKGKMLEKENIFKESNRKYEDDRSDWQQLDDPVVPRKHRARENTDHLKRRN